MIAFGAALLHPTGTTRFIVAVPSWVMMSVAAGVFVADLLTSRAPVLEAAWRRLRHQHHQ
jgi:hypothetical protein